jgi:hypothetical protein
MIMARALLETWGAPTVVTAVDLDAGAARVVRSENTQVSGLEKTATGLAWSQLDGALPLPLPSRARRTSPRAKARPEARSQPG